MIKKFPAKQWNRQNVIWRWDPFNVFIIVRWDENIPLMYL
jgi:hypothetical protein